MDTLKEMVFGSSVVDSTSHLIAFMPAMGA
jgi:hypothetical protein